MANTQFIMGVLAAAGLAAGVGQASAVEHVATVTTIQGIALVNQGSEYVTATPGMSLRTGDRMMAMEGGSVALTFSDGCIYTMSDNEILTVGSASSCTAGTLASTRVGPYVAAAGVVVGPALAGAIAAGTLATVVIVGAASNSGSDNRSRISP